MRGRIGSGKVSAALYKSASSISIFIDEICTVVIGIMNTLIIALSCVLAVAFAAPPSKDKDEPIPVLAYSYDGPYPEGSYNYNYKTGNGIEAQEQGQLVKISDKDDAIRVQGSYSYFDEAGNPISVNYIADENGFQPKGDHLPVAPPVPPAILKALEYIAAHPEEDNL